jgi:lysophospholipase L1-like esterase
VFRVRHHPRLARLVLLCGSTAIAMGLVEAGLRLTYHHQRRAKIAKYLAADGQPIVVASDIPGLVYTCRPNVGGANSQGYDDEEHSIEKPPGTFRIVVIGDSIAAGHGVGSRDSFCRLLENELNNGLPGGQCEVIVLARSGYATSQELVLLRNEAFQYGPDLILWSYVLNDPADPLYHDASGDLRMVYEPKIHILHLLRQAWFGLREAIRTRGGPQEYHKRLHYAYWDQVAENLGEIGRLCGEHQVPVVFLLHPILEADRPSFDDSALLDLYENLKDLAERSGLVPVDLREAFRDCVPAELNFRDDPWHPNALGHRLIAHFLRRRLAHFQNTPSLSADRKWTPVGVATTYNAR